MDSNIRLLIHGASESNDLPSLDEAYNKLKKERQSGPNEPESVSADLFVLCAEAAFKYGRLDVMEDCIKMFFLKTPPSNQFLCRAYLCHAQLYAPTSANNPEQIDKAVEYLLKAINFAKKNPRYYFLVYNASVLYWQFCRPFLKPNYRQYLAKSLHQVVKALDDIDDKDYEWRAQLMIALIECHVDAGRKEDASQVSNATLLFTKSNVPGLYITVLGLQVRHRLTDLAKVSKEAKASNELYIFYKIQRLRMQLEFGEKVDVDVELSKLYKNIVKGIDMERSSTAMSTTSTSTVSYNKASSPVAVGSSDRIPLLLDLGRLCLEQDRPELGGDCMEALKGNIKEPGMLLEVEFMKCELMVKSLGVKKETYTKSVVETRIKAIRKLEQFITTAVRLGNPNVIQAGCVTMWNLCLPLLQSNLNNHVRKPLTLVAQALEDIESLLVLLRCQIHMELAKCEEAEDQLEYALTHLHRAIALNDSGQYKDRLETALTRLQLRATLYKTPERPEDLAAMIIEQARASDDSSTTRMKRASLVKAGEALSPDAFKHVLASESNTTDPSAGKGPPTVLSKLAGKAAQFDKAVSKAAGHLKRLGDENDQERVRIWADLGKTARKQQVWDVARVSARFCLLYDDGRWSQRGTSSYGADKNTAGAPGETEAEDQRTKSPSLEKPVRTGSGVKVDPIGMKLTQLDGMTPFTVEQDLMRTLAQVHLINAEALVQLLKIEGVQLGDQPIPPEDTIKLRPKRYGDQQINFDELPEWVSYCEWIKSLSDNAVKGFQRAAEIGVELSEPWLVVNAAVYLWNYTNHMLTQLRFREVVPIYTPVLEALKDTGHAGEAVLLCDMCNAKAQGLMQPWIPNLTAPAVTTSPSKDKPEGGKAEKGGKGRQSGKGARGANAKPSVAAITVDPDGAVDLKQATEVLEYALSTTSGAELKNLVPMSVRHPLIKSWVFCKQLLNQQIPKNLGHDDENPHSQGPMSRALCAVEMLSLVGNGLSDLNPCPTLQEAVRMVENCLWSDRLVELEMWSRLTVLAYNADSHPLVMQCGHKAIGFAESNQCLARKQPKKQDRIFQHKLVVEQEMLYYASVVMGQSLMKNMLGKNEIRRDALICFVNACRFGQKAGTYELVITAARHYWNAIKPFIGKPIERELLKEPMEAVLECIAAVAGKGMGKDEEEEEEETEAAEKPTKKKTASNKGAKEKEKKGKEKEKEKKKGKGDKGGGKGAKGSDKSEVKDDKGKAKAPPEKEEKPALPSVYDEDLKLRAAMYGVLFQAYADKCEWEQGLRAMDQAVKDMPRTYHRLLIFKHRVITKAKLGRPVTFDMGKFKDESDEVISSMWRHVALNSKDPMDQLSAYQNAIEVLESSESDWQKVDYLMELGEWLFVNEFPVVDAMDQFLWAADIMLNRSSVRSETPAPDKDDSENESELEASKYVPRKQQSVIGMRPSDVEIKMEEITDIRQLETLGRIHVMLAQIAGRSSPHYKDYVLLAFAFVQRIWQVSIYSAEKLHKEGAKPGERVPSKRGKEKSKEVKESQSRIDKTSSKSCMPTSMEGWSTFEPPEKIHEYFKCDVTGTMVNRSTFQKPMLSVYYLEVLLEDLRALGFHQLGLPVVALLQFLADVTVQYPQLSKLIHLRALELCQELNLVASVAHHEKAAGQMILEEQEQARSREDIEMWKEEQRQVKAEEERTKNSKSVVFDLNTTNLNNLRRPQAPGKLEILEDEPWNKHKVLLGRVCDREVWTAQAEILIRQGHYQAARQLLNEANLSARAFDDNTTLSKILTQLAVLALAESNWGQACILLLEAQKLQGDQKFWLNTTLLLVEATLLKKERHSIALCEPDRQAKEKARGFLMHAKATFQELSEDNPNKANMADYIEAILRARLGTMLSEDLLQNSVARKRKHAFKDLENACQHLSSASESLLQLGYKREAVRVMVRHASIRRLFVEESCNEEERHENFLEVLRIIRSAVTVADGVLYEVQSSSSLSELKNLSLPVHREAVEVRLLLADLMVDMFVQFSREDRARRVQEARKGSVEKMIADFVRIDSALSDKQEEWQQITRTLSQDIFMHLSVAHGLAGNIPYLKAKTLFILGRCLRVLASHTSPDGEDQWKELQDENPSEVQADNTSSGLLKQTIDSEKQGGGESGEEQETGSVQQLSKETLKQINNASRLKLVYSNSKKFLTQGVECLAQSVQMGLRNGFRDLVEKASFELVECVGLHDCSTSSQYLALYQSCHMSRVLERVLRRSQVDPSVSRQAALLYQRQLMSNVDFLNDHTCTVMGINYNSLSDCEAWKRLQIMRQHLELTKEFSATNNQFIVLQHSPDRRWLYGAVMDKGRSSIPSGKANKQTGAVPIPSKAIIARAKVNPDDMNKLIEEFGVFKSETASELLRRNYVINQQEQRRIMLDKLEENPEPDSQAIDDPMAVEKEHQLESHFQDVTLALECYLEPIMTKLRPALQSPVLSDTVVLLADEWLLRLPLEALDALRVPEITSLSRDFSLQMHYYRLHHGDGSESDSKTDAKKGGKKDSKGKSDKPSTGKKSEKKGMKELGGGIPKEGLTSDINGLRYIVDPHDECGEAGEGSPATVMTELIAKHKPLTQKWEGLMGSDHLPSVGEWQRVLAECCVFMFYGTERCLGSFPPRLLSPMNLAECHAVLLLDLVQTSKSFLRQGREDAAKTMSDLALEQPLETAMLFSLAGVGCVVLNQWHTRLPDSRQRVATYMTSLLEESKTAGQAVRDLVDFPKPPEPEAEVEAASDRGSKDSARGGEGTKDQTVGSEQVSGECVESGNEQAQVSAPPPRRWFNTVLYGTGNVSLNSGKG